MLGKRKLEHCFANNMHSKMVEFTKDNYRPFLDPGMDASEEELMEEKYLVAVCVCVWGGGGGGGGGQVN